MVLDQICVVEINRGTESCTVSECLEGQAVGRNL